MPVLAATLADYRAYTGDDGADLTPRALLSASLLVGRACRFARYEAAADGLPVVQSLRDALRNATCEVLAHRDEVGVSSPLGRVQSASIGGASYTVSAGDTTSDVYVVPVDAWLILEDAGLVGDGTVTVYG